MYSSEAPTTLPQICTHRVTGVYSRAICPHIFRHMPHSYRHILNIHLQPVYTFTGNHTPSIYCKIYRPPPVYCIYTILRQCIVYIVSPASIYYLLAGDHTPSKLICIRECMNRFQFEFPHMSMHMPYALIMRHR
jgi:hypothetical protein